MFIRCFVLLCFYDLYVVPVIRPNSKSSYFFFYYTLIKSILTLSFFILLYSLPVAHTQVNPDIDYSSRTRNTHYKLED